MSVNVTEEKYKSTYGNKAYVFIIIGFAALIFFDQLTKKLAVAFLKDSQPFVLIDNALELRYLENRGAAFGMLQGMQYFFWILTIVFVVLLVIVMIKIPKNRFYLPLICSMTVLCAGAVGNFIDRISHKYVVDFIYFSLIDYPIFNVADIYVTLSVIVIAVLVLFHYKDNDFSFIRRKRKADSK